MVRKGAADLRSHGRLLSSRRHFVIFNPVSGRSGGGKRILNYERLLCDALDDVSFGATTHAGHERELAAEAVDEGYDVIVAVGGDGTWSNVADPIIESDRDDVAFALLPSGTGNDFGRNFGYDPRSPEAAVQVLAAGHTRLVDAGRLDTPSAAEHTPGHMESRNFLNLIGFGFDIAVIDAAEEARFLRGELLYKLTALQQLVRFPGFESRVVSASGEDRSTRTLMLTVSNGRFFGGGFPIAPAAAVDDGRLHACIIGDAPFATRFRMFNLAERGRHIESERVEVIDDRSFRLHFDAPPRFEMDGDVRRSSEAVMEVRSLPGALRVVAPPVDGR